MTRLFTRLAIAAILPTMAALAFIVSTQAQNVAPGSIRISGIEAEAPTIIPTLNCTPAPCVLPNVQASVGKKPANDVNVVWDQTESSIVATDYNCSPSLQGYYLSTTGGSKWTHSCEALAPGATAGDGEPLVGADLNGNFYRGGVDGLSNGMREVVVAKSSDGGKSWGTPVVATVIAGTASDHPSLAVNIGANSPYKNTLMVASAQIDASRNTQIYVSNSQDGVSWATAAVSSKAVFPNVVEFPSMASDDATTAVVAYLECRATGKASNCAGTTATMYTQKSTDNGSTWGAPIVIGRVALAPGTCGGFYGCLPNTSEPVNNIPAIAFDNSGGARNGWLYCADYNWTGAYMQVQVTTSTDDGNTWGKPVPVAPKTDTHDQFFPSLSVGFQDLIGVTWLDRRNDAANVNYEAFGAISRNGYSFNVNNYQLATAPSNPSNDGFGGTNLGDRTGSSWIGTRFYATWPDTRNGTNAQAEVGGIKQ